MEPTAVEINFRFDLEEAADIEERYYVAPYQRITPYVISFEGPTGPTTRVVTTWDELRRIGLQAAAKGWVLEVHLL